MLRTAPRERGVRIGERRRHIFSAVNGSMFSRHCVSSFRIRSVHMDLRRGERRHKRIMLSAASPKRSVRIGE